MTLACLEKGPKHPGCHWSVGEAFERLGDLPAARDALKRAIDLGASCPLHLAGVQLSLGDVDAADALVRAELEKERARASNPDGLYFYHSLNEQIVRFSLAHSAGIFDAGEVLARITRVWLRVDRW